MPPVIDFEPAKDAIRDRHLDYVLDDTLREPYNLRWVPAKTGSFDTACWSLVRINGELTHLIAFGERLAERCLSERLLPEYALRFYYHELEHSISTVRNLALLSSRCGSRKIPFGLLNLAEDARIEDRARKRWNKNFDWLLFEAKFTGCSPTGLLLQIIQADGDCVQAANCIHEDTTPLFNRITGYYRRFVDAPSTWALIPILEEWIGEFGSDAPPAGDMAAGLAIASSPDALNNFLDESGEIEGKAGPKAGDQTGSVTLRGAGNHQFCTEILNTLDLDRIADLADRLRKAFQHGSHWTNTATPGRRLNLQAVMRGSERIYRHKESGARGRKPRVHWIQDCSGSMGYVLQVRVDGVHLLGALDELARTGSIDGTLTLTAGYDDQACCETFHLPVGHQVLERIPSDGGCECFANALEVLLPNLEPGDLILAYTDGAIMDEAIARDKWHSCGLYSLGLYIGGTDQTEALEQWFDAGLNRTSAEAMADELSELLTEKLHATLRT